MGRTYSVPRNVKGESRILYIFSIKSLITTLIGALVGLPVFLLFSKMGMTIVGLVIIALFAAIGYGIGVLSIPDTPLVGNLRKAGGEKVSDILIRTVTFQKRKKIYIYRYEKKDDKSKVIVNNEENETNDLSNNSNDVSNDNVKEESEEL